MTFFFIGIILLGCHNTESIPDPVANKEKRITENKTINTEIQEVSAYYYEINDSVEDMYYYDDSATTEYIEEYPILDSQAVGINFNIYGNYTDLKNKIASQRKKAYLQYALLTDSIEKQMFIDSIGGYITNVLLNKVFPHWYNTTWDFNGTTEIPGSGYVACGYFVSTTLRDVGINMNRYKFAQQTGLVGAKTLQMGREIKKFYNRDLSEISKDLVEKLKPGLYQVGLSCHVGYLLIRNGEAYFIHSNYIHTGVMIERAADSEAFESSIYVVSDITYNRKLIEKWILGSRIEIIK